MKAALIDRYGNNDVVRVRDLAVPTIGDTDLLVQVHAASVNPVDVKTRDGKLTTLLKYRFPLVVGNDLAGVISDVGAQVTRFKKGDAIFARVDACVVPRASRRATSSRARLYCPDRWRSLITSLRSCTRLLRVLF